MAASMVEKYEALAQLPALDEAARVGPIRTIARTWPGALREAELAGPDQCGARLTAARQGASEPERTRDGWRAASAEAIVLWADLHALLRDLARWRGRRETDRSVAAFVRWTASDETADRWTGEVSLSELAPGPRVRTRDAYLWLARRAGLRMPALNHILFAREGPWDQRPGDPAW